MTRRYLKRWVWTVHTNFENTGGQFSQYDREEDAYFEAARFAIMNVEGQRNFDKDAKKHLRKLWKKKDYKGVVAYWGEIMAESFDHLDFISVEKTRLRVRLEPKARWKHKRGQQDPEVPYLPAVPSLRRCATKAEDAIALYSNRMGHAPFENEEEGLSDLLSDLRHLCDAKGYSFGKLLKTSLNNYTHEIDGRA